MKLNYWERSWSLDEKLCPCDVDFVDYLIRAGIQGKAIFHFGTGEHHIVGTKNLEVENPNEILGITASKREHEAYVEAIIGNPHLALSYKVLFADIYTLSARMLPRFDVVTLFHLCEFYSEANRAYTQADDWSVLRMFVDSLRPGGRLLLYRGSGAFSKARPLVELLLLRGGLSKEADHKSLEVFRKPAESGMDRSIATSEVETATP